MFLIGTDEAGYGPNLGPLVVSLTTWEVRSDAASPDLYDLLGNAVTRSGAGNSFHEVPIADSKQLYKARGSLASLERSVLATLAASGSRVTCWRDLWKTLAANSHTPFELLPWYKDYEQRLPVDCSPEAIRQTAETFVGALESAHVTLRDVQSVILEPGVWNDQLDVHGNKATVLANETLRLVKRGIDSLPPGPILVQCDKFGGRNRYAQLLQQLFPDYLVEIRRESRPLSTYRWGPPPARVECRFAAKGETFLPTALASMVSKYVRELGMRAFNHFWRQRIPELRPTAGYPVDARRFKADIDAEQQILGIDDRQIWRNK